METLYTWLCQSIDKHPVIAVTILIVAITTLIVYDLGRLKQDILSLGDYVDEMGSLSTQRYNSTCASINTLTSLYQKLNGRIEDPAFKGDLAIAKDLVALVNGFLETNNQNRLDLSTRFESHREILQELVATCSRLDTRINVQQMAVQDHIEKSNKHFCRLDNGLQSLEESLSNRLDEVESALETMEDALKYGTASDTDAVKDELLDLLETKQATQDATRYMQGAPVRCDHCVVTLDGQFLGEATVMVSQPRGSGLVEPTRLEIVTSRLDEKVSAVKAETSQLAPEAGFRSPKVGDWVKINKPKDSPLWWPAMHKYDGQVVQVTEIDGEAIIHDEWAFCFEWLEPAKAPLNSNKIPEGYRKLKDSSIEPRVVGDLYWSISKGRYVAIVLDHLPYANRHNWAACRKTSPEVTGEVTGEVETEWVDAVWPQDWGKPARFWPNPICPDEGTPDDTLWELGTLAGYIGYVSDVYRPWIMEVNGKISCQRHCQVRSSQREHREVAGEVTEEVKPRFSRGELVKIVCPKGLLPGEHYRDPISKATFSGVYYQVYLGKDGQIVGPSSTTTDGLWEVMVLSRGLQETIRLPEAMLEKVLS